MTTSPYKTIDDLPVTLSASEIAKILTISRSNAYRLLRTPGFPTLRIGAKRLVVTKQNLLRWIEQNSGDIT